MSRTGSPTMFRFLLICALVCGFAVTATVLAGTARAEDGKAAAEGEEGGLGKIFTEPPLRWANDAAIYTALVFLILFLILWRFAWGPISDGLHKREQGIVDNIAAAQRQNEEAKVMLSQYEAKLAAAASEVRELLEEARRDAEHTKDEIVASARKEAQAERDRALGEINTARDQALKDLAERSADMAVDLAGRIMHARLTKDDHAALIREAVGSFVKVEHGNN